VRILVHDYAGHAFTLQLARSLAARDHEVLYLHGGGLRAPRGNMQGRPSDPTSLRIATVEIHERLLSRAGPGRLMQERRYGSALARQVYQYRADVVLSVPSSLDAQRAALVAATGSGAGFVYWLQDFYSQAVERLLGRHVPAAGRLLAAPFARLERDTLRRSDAVIAITDDFVAPLRSWAISRDAVAVIPNWAPLEDLRPLAKVNAWSKEHGLTDRQNLVYSGTLGRKHDPGLLLGLADGLPDASVVVVAEGAGARKLGKAAGTRRNNLTLLPIQPAPRLPEVLASADVLVAILDEDANVFSVPSKVLTYLAAGRPILAAIPRANLAARTINRAGAGRTVEPGDHEEFVEAATEMLANPNSLAAAGAAARAYAEEAFEIGAITDAFEVVLRDARRMPASIGSAPDTGGAPDPAQPEAKA